MSGSEDLSESGEEELKEDIKNSKKHKRKHHEDKKLKGSVDSSHSINNPLES